MGLSLDLEMLSETGILFHQTEKLMTDHFFDEDDLYYLPYMRRKG